MRRFSNLHIPQQMRRKNKLVSSTSAAWGKPGEAAGNLRKGSRCFVEGRLQTRSYETQTVKTVRY